MVKELAFATALLAALPSSALAQSACGGPREMTVCEAELYQAGVIWEGRAREERARLEGCQEKLTTRTATVVKTLIVPGPPAHETPSLLDSALILAGVAGSGLGLGLLLGLLLSP
tara:strand:- start:4211 stop:4555 length:345 start_codon:yes stop_codon:yes gene_type:complete